MKKDACAITGHRPKSFPWKYDEAAPRCVLLKKILAEQISELTDRRSPQRHRGYGALCAEAEPGDRYNQPVFAYHFTLRRLKLE